MECVPQGLCAGGLVLSVVMLRNAVEAFKGEDCQEALRSLQGCALRREITVGLMKPMGSHKIDLA